MRNPLFFKTNYYYIIIIYLVWTIFLINQWIILIIILYFTDGIKVLKGVIKMHHCKYILPCKLRSSCLANSSTF